MNHDFEFTTNWQRNLQTARTSDSRARQAYAAEHYHPERVSSAIKNAALALFVCALCIFIGFLLSRSLT